MFKILNTILKELGNHKWSTPKWKYQILTDEKYPYLHGPEYLKELANEAINKKDKESLVHVLNHMARHNAQNWDGYKSVFKFIKKAVEELGFIWI
jgi:hypothetical protein